jgi:hypothetical protein
MPLGEMTEDAKNDLTVIKMRSSLHKDRFFKSNDSDTLPKFFQVNEKFKVVQIRFSILILINTNIFFLNNQRWVKLLTIRLISIVLEYRKNNRRKLF